MKDMILVTGFEPFGGLVRNPSGEAALALAGDGVSGAVLPVDYGRLGPALEELFGADFEAVLLMGVAVGRSKLSLERVAINFRDSTRPDNSGTPPLGPEVVPGGPAAYFSTLPLERIKTAVSEGGLPVEISLTAGAYLCNASFYRARHMLESRGTPCGFLHLPATPDLACGAEPMAFEEELRGIRLILDELRR